MRPERSIRSGLRNWGRTARMKSFGSGVGDNIPRIKGKKLFKREECAEKRRWSG